MGNSSSADANPLFSPLDVVQFTINGKKYEATSDLAADTSLNTFIRDRALLKGTKFMCSEGGCGCCIVAAAIPNPVTKKKTICAVNSCLVLVFACQGWDITTIEGLGNRSTGYHVVQKKLADFDGTQCGFCSPGMVMNMYSLLETNDKMTKSQIENSFGGNICRCTGYRKILDAFKSFAEDAPKSERCIAGDIEDLNKNYCPKTGRKCAPSCPELDIEFIPEAFEFRNVFISNESSTWIKVTTIDEIFSIIQKPQSSPYMLVHGGTAHGVYRRPDNIAVFIDIKDVEDLHGYTAGTIINLGGNLSLTRTIEALNMISQTRPEFAYTKQIASHLEMVAHIPVRNIGSLAGNLTIKHEHNEFASDIFLLIETVKGKIKVLSAPGFAIELTPVDYLAQEMDKKIIGSIILPALDNSYKFKSYKVMKRNQNAHAIVNAGFLFKINKDGVIQEKPNIVYGGINPQFVHATQTETFLNGKNILTGSVLQTALKTLHDELNPNPCPPEPSPEYRKQLAVSLFYKYLLSIFSDKVAGKYKSGGTNLQRTVSSASQTFDTDKSLWPLNQPIPKIDGLIQCSGEAQYINDMLPRSGELFGALVLTTIGKGTILNIDAKDALECKGVVAFYTAEDVPGKNTFIPAVFFLNEVEEIFCSGKVTYAGQPVGMVVANSYARALAAARKVKIQYVGVEKPVVNLRDAIQAEKNDSGESDSMGPNVIKGKFDVGSQYHYSMEMQLALAIPEEEDIIVHASSQWVDIVQRAVALSLAIPENRVTVVKHRLGGAFGCKISRSQAACAAAVAAFNLKTPVRVVLDMETNLEAIGKRTDNASDYEVNVDGDGKIQSFKAKLYENLGNSKNESVIDILTIESFKGPYIHDNWQVETQSILTNIPCTISMRAPGSCEGTAFIENIMDDIAATIKKDPISVRLKNMVKDNNPLPEMWNAIKESASYEKRKKDVEDFNKNNRWLKKGIAAIPLKWDLLYFGSFRSTVSIFAMDGTVSVTHGGVDMGQGLNTKVIQVCAYTLGIPLDMVRTKPATSDVIPNDFVSGGSCTSESVCLATVEACKELLRRLQPIKEKMKNPTWKELVAQAYAEFVDLSAGCAFDPKKTSVYVIYGWSITEVIMHVLTGEHQVLRVDILEDVGRSISPLIDIGQIEGGFVQGLAYWTQEEVIYDKDSGRLLTNRSWNYKPPIALDIPIDFRVAFRKNSVNPAGVLGSKATGEPPLCLSFSVILAIRNAIRAARSDAGSKETTFTLNAPYTREKIFMACQNKLEDYKLK